ncbi:MAG: helix-turn-helix domain-containing protein [Butyricicoccus pullicaecorum]|nr:helix-turn-helix domain-containing protein [Butyricicoccus pullicaecorum]
MLRLKELRIKHNKTQKELAAFLGIDRTTYTKYETGASEPALETLSRLSAYYHVDIDYLIGMSEIEKKASTIEQVDAKELQLLKDLVNQLTPDQQQELLRYGRYLASQPPFSKEG